MKLHSPSLSCLALAATLALASCGGGSSDNSSNDSPGQDQSSDKDKKKKKGKGGEILPQFRGAWVYAENVLGEADPKAKSCEANAVGSFKGSVTLDKKVGTQEIRTFVSTSNCTGNNLIVRKTTYNYEVVSTADNSQIVRAPKLSYTYSIAGEFTVKMLNDAKVCGHTDWQAGLYRSEEKKLQTCTDRNTFDLIAPYQKPDSAKDILARFRPAGKGMVIDQRNSKVENSEFGLPLYLARP